MLYDEDLEDLGYVMNATRLWAHHPALVDGLFELLGHAVRAGALTFRAARHPGHRVRVHAGRLLLLAGLGRQARRARPAPRWPASVLRGDDSGLDPAERALAGWARRVARRPERDHRAGRRRRCGTPASTTRRSSRSPLFVALRLAFSTVNDALGARPDRALLDELPEAVSAAVTWGRPVEEA